MAEGATFESTLKAIAVGIIVGLLTVVWMLWPSPVQATAKPAAMPAQLDLGGVSWRVDVVETPGNSLGFLAYTRCEVRRIEVKTDVADKREAVMHEILHAYTCQDSKTDFDVENFYYNSKTENGHEGYDRIAAVVADALQRNPSLAAYLAEVKQ
jgi:hypothetical protein